MNGMNLVFHESAAHCSHSILTSAVFYARGETRVPRVEVVRETRRNVEMLSMLLFGCPVFGCPIFFKIGQL